MTEQIINGTRYIDNIRTSPEYSFEFPFEREFVIKDAFTWIGKHWIDSIYWCSAYIFIIFGGKVSVSCLASSCLTICEYGLQFSFLLKLGSFSNLASDEKPDAIQVAGAPVLLELRSGLLLHDGPRSLLSWGHSCLAFVRVSLFRLWLLVLTGPQGHLLLVVRVHLKQIARIGRYNFHCFKEAKIALSALVLLKFT